MSEIQGLLEEATRRAASYWHSIDERRVSPQPEAVESLAKLREPFPQGPTGALETFSMLESIGSPATVATTGGRYFGFVIGGVLPAALASNWMSAVWDQNSCLTAMSPIASVLEEITIGWVREAMGFDFPVAGAFVTGATMANFTGLAAARHALLAREGWNVEEDGLAGAPPITVIAGEEAHSSVLKAISMLGLGRSRVIKVEMDEQGRMRADRMPEIPARSIVCLQAGNVNSGAFDPAGEICRKAHQAGAWVHVDGAFGLWARVSPAFGHLTAGFELADSWALDNHKWLNVNYDSAIALVRSESDLIAAFASAGAYLKPGETREPMLYSAELSRRARGIDVWAAMKSLGREGLVDLIDRTCRYARDFAEGLRDAGFDILSDVVINQALVSFGDNERTRRVIQAIQQDGTCWCGGTEWHGRAAMRISVSSWKTTDADVARSLEAMIRCAKNTL